MNERHWQEAASNARSYADHRQNQRLSEISAAIRIRRRQLRMTQAEVAARAGIPQPHLSRLETGRASTPTIAVLDRIAFALGLTFVAQFDNPKRALAEDPPPPAPPATATVKDTARDTARGNTAVKRASSDTGTTTCPAAGTGAAPYDATSQPAAP